jgi:hypothetical protein
VTVEPPALSSKDIVAKLEQLYRYERRHHLIAFFGSGQDDTVEVRGAGRFMVVPVASELDLRDQLNRLEEDARAAFLVPWSTEVPLDLRGRFARSGKVLRVGAHERLLRMFRASEISDGARNSALARYLLAHPPEHDLAVSSGSLTEEALYSTWLTREVSGDLGAGLDLDVLLGWAGRDGHGPAFVKRFAGDDGEPVRQGLLQFFERKLGPAARLAWRAWEEGKGGMLLAYSILFESWPTFGDAAKVWGRLRLEQHFGVQDAAEAERVIEQLGGAVTGALTIFERATSKEEARRLRSDADARVDDPSARQALRYHRRLPSAWRHRLDDLGAVLERGARDPSEEVLRDARAALEGLRSHERYPDEQATHEVKRALMGVRLLAFLLARTDRRTEGTLTPHGDATALGGWYATEGGYLDWARSIARGSAAGTFGTGLLAVVDAVDAVRAELDARFAKGMEAWIRAGRPSADALPIDHALKRLAVPFLEEDEDRKMLVLLMDGMAWAQAVELLQALGERNRAWGPLAWHASKVARVGTAPFPPVFANLPTVTEVSRSAFFAGAPMVPGAKLSTAKDPQRFEAHPELSRLEGSKRKPRLLLRAESSTAGGALTTEAMTLIRDAGRRVVGVVVNAIDASLKRDPQQFARWDVEAIAPLADLLEVAQEAGRQVLLASDHGHVPVTGRMAYVSAESGSARHRAWVEGSDELGPGEVRLGQAEGVYTPPGHDAVVLLTGEAHRYAKGRTAGEHGGLALAEVVAPCLLLGPATERPEDEALEVVGAPVPDWWLLRIRKTSEADPAEDRTPRRKKAPSPSQLELLDRPRTPKKKKPTKPPPPTHLSHPLASAPLFKRLAKDKDQRETILKAVDFLQGQQGVASQEAFAAAMGHIAWRVPGVVSTLQGVLNVDGYPVLSFDPMGQQVRLDVEKLFQQFDLPRGQE